jgi:hypothetical protein
MKKEFSVEVLQSVPISFSVMRASGFEIFRNVEEMVMRIEFRPHLPKDLTLRESKVVAADPMFMLTFWNGEFIRLTILACAERLLMPFSPAVLYCKADDTAYLWFVKPEARVVRRERTVEQKYCNAVITFLYNATHHLVGIEVVGASNAFSGECFIEKAEALAQLLVSRSC